MTGITSIPPAVAAHLRAHGLAVEPVDGEAAVEVARVETVGTEGGRAILEAAGTGELGVSWSKGTRRVPAGYAQVRTDQPLGAIAVYLCEPESDDGAAENGLVAAPARGSEWPIWRRVE